MELIIEGNNVKFTDEQATLIKQSIIEFNVWDNEKFIQQLEEKNEYNINLYMDLSKSELLIKKLIFFFEKGRKKLSMELTIELIGILCYTYCKIFEENLNEIAEELSHTEGYEKDLREMNQEFYDSFHEDYFGIKNYLVDYEYIINFLSLSLMGDLVYPKYDSYPAIDVYENLIRSINTYDKYINYVKDVFEID